MMMHCKRAGRVIWLLAPVWALPACQPTEADKVLREQQRKIYCLDHRCPGDSPPKYDYRELEILKINGEWFVGPKEYYSAGINGASFYWWERKPYSSKALPDGLKNARHKNGSGSYTIEIFFRSSSIPQEPHGFRLIQWAQSHDLVLERKTIRPGLDRLRLSPDAKDARGYRLDHITYYVATDMKGVDGLPPVASCSHEDVRNTGGTGFLLSEGLWVGGRWNQEHCADWPEIFTEISRIVSLLKRA